MRDSFVYLFVFIAFIIYAIFLKEIAFFLISSFDNLFPHGILVFPWIALVVILSIRFLKKIDGLSLDQGSTLFFYSMAGFILSLFNFLVVEGVHLATGIYSYISIEHNYIGVYGVSEGYDHNSMTEVYTYHNSNVYNATDSRIKENAGRMAIKHDESYERGFIFWQTAYAYGFDPKGIANYQRLNSIGKPIVLFMTVGPFFLTESFIKSLAETWILFLFPIAFLFFKTKPFEKNLLPYINYFSKRNKTS